MLFAEEWPLGRNTFALLTFRTVLNDGTVVFQIVLFPQCLKIQLEEWQSIEPCILEIL